jgi:hypothetical protein
MAEIDTMNIESSDDVAALVAYGEAAASRNDKAAARTALRRALKLDPASVPAMLALAQVAGTFSERRQLFEQVLARDPGNIAARGGLEALQSGVANPHPISERAPIDATPLTPPITEALYCYRHPSVETGLRCIQCANPICATCAKATPVGFLCPDCRKARRSPLYNVTPLDAAKGAAVSVVAGAVGSFVSSIAGIFILFFFGALLGEMVMRIITWATNKRGPIMQAAAGAGLVAGALLPLLFLRLNWIGLLIFLVIGIGTIVARLR